jgi:hypothetical protein
MAVSQTIAKTSLNISKISSSVFKTNKSLDAAGKSAFNINKTLSKRNENTKKNIATDKLLFARRRENVRRQEQESIIESSGIGGVVRRQGNIIAESTKGFLGRMMDFVGTLLVGWLLNNLPTIIGLAQELIARIQRLVGILNTFVSTTVTIFKTLGSSLGAIYTDVVKFQFTFPETRKQFQTSMNDLENAFSQLTGSFDDLTKLFTTPLTQKTEEGRQEGSYSGEAVPEAGSTWGGGTKESSLFELIAGGEGGYESMNRGNANDSPGGAKKYLGKNLQDMTLSEIMSLQSQRKVFAVGKYQIVTGTMPGFVRWLQSKGYDPKTTKYSAKIQDLYPQYTIESKRPQVGKFLSGSMNDIQKANLELAAEFASVGVPFDMKAGSYGGGWPKRDIKKGESLYSGAARNRASISPEKVQQALKEAKASRSSGSNISSPQQPSVPPNASSTSIVAAAQSLKGMSTKTAPGTSGGREACVYAINQVYRKAGLTPPWGNSLRVSNAEASMKRAGYFEVPINQRQAGDIIIVYDRHPSEPQIHIGIVLPNGNMLSNSSSKGTFTWEDSPENVFKTYAQGRGYGKCYRMPGGLQPSPAQITAQQPRTTAVAGQVTQERRGPTVFVAPQAPTSTPPPMGGGYEGSSMGGMLILDSLNRYTTQKLLLELAYT